MWQRSEASLGGRGGASGSGHGRGRSGGGRRSVSRGGGRRDRDVFALVEGDDDAGDVIHNLFLLLPSLRALFNQLVRSKLQVVPVLPNQLQRLLESKRRIGKAPTA